MLHILCSHPYRAARTLGAALTALLLTVATSIPAPAQAPAALDSLVQRFRAEYGVPAVVVGVTTRDAAEAFPYGSVASGSEVRPDADTRFEVGSVTKLFTGLLLAEMAERGEVAIDEPIGRLLPDTVSSPVHDGREIGLVHLSTHTSGLPPLPENLVPTDMADPYAGYTLQQLYSFLHGHRPGRAAGEQYQYSNLGVGLLGHLLARRAGQDYPSLLRARVLEPLGLHDTYVVERDAADDGMVRGESADGPVPNWQMGVLAGAGGMRSSAADLLRFLRLQLDPDASALADAIRASQRIHHAQDGALELALGWHVIQLPEAAPLYFHNGGTGGFRAFVAFAPARDIGIVLLANRDVPMADFDRFALQLTRTVLADAG